MSETSISRGTCIAFSVVLDEGRKSPYAERLDDGGQLGLALRNIVGNIVVAPYTDIECRQKAPANNGDTHGQPGRRCTSSAHSMSGHAPGHCRNIIGFESKECHTWNTYCLTTSVAHWTSRRTPVLRIRFSCSSRASTACATNCDSSWKSAWTSVSQEY